MTILAFDIGGSTVKYGLFDHLNFETKLAAASQQTNIAHILSEISPLTGFHQIPIPQDWTTFVQKIENIIATSRPYLSNLSQLKIGMSVAGVKDPATAKIMSGNVPAIEAHCLEHELSDILSVPVITANDADCFVLCESLYVDKSQNALVFGIILGTGVGGGLVLNNRLITGAHGFCGEWGHGNNLTALCQSHGIKTHICGCGKADCLDIYGSARGLERIYQSISGHNLDAISILTRWEAITTGAETKPAELTDQLLLKTVSCYLDIIGPQLVTIVNLLDPIAIPVGGGLGQNHALVKALDAYVAERNLGANQQGGNCSGLIRPALSCENGGILGAAILACT